MKTLSEIAARTAESEESFMRQWESGSPMRTFIYYLQRATCGALAYLVLHQTVLGLRLLQPGENVANFFEGLLYFFSSPGRLLVANFCDPLRPLNLPPPLAEFFVNIVIYFVVSWLGCFLYNLIRGKTYLGKRGDPFAIVPSLEAKSKS